MVSTLAPTGPLGGVGVAEPGHERCPWTGRVPPPVAPQPQLEGRAGKLPIALTGAPRPRTSVAPGVVTLWGAV